MRACFTQLAGEVEADLLEDPVSDGDRVRYGRGISSDLRADQGKSSVVGSMDERERDQRPPCCAVLRVTCQSLVDVPVPVQVEDCRSFTRPAMPHRAVPRQSLEVCHGGLQDRCHAGGEVGCPVSSPYCRSRSPSSSITWPIFDGGRVRRTWIAGHAARRGSCRRADGLPCTSALEKPFFRLPKQGDHEPDPHAPKSWPWWRRRCHDPGDITHVPSKAHDRPDKSKAASSESSDRSA